MIAHHPRRARWQLKGPWRLKDERPGEGGLRPYLSSDAEEEEPWAGGSGAGGLRAGGSRSAPAHPYTLGLKAAMPSNVKGQMHRLMPIEGSPPDLFKPPAGCGYYARCPYAMRVCEKNNPEEFTISGKHFARCWLQHPSAPKVEGELFQTHHTENA